MQAWLNLAKGGYFCAVWSRRFLLRSFVSSSEFGSAVMKTHTVTVCSSRPPPGKWFRARVFEKMFIAIEKCVWSPEFFWKVILPSIWSTNQIFIFAMLILVKFKIVLSLVVQELKVCFRYFFISIVDIQTILVLYFLDRSFTSAFCDCQDSQWNTINIKICKRVKEQIWGSIKNGNHWKWVLKITIS